MNQTLLIQDYLAKNQAKINKRLSIFILAFVILCPALLLADNSHLMKMDMLTLVVVCALIMIVSVLPAVCVRYCPNDTWNRRICLVALEILICIISCNGIIDMEVLFVAVPIVSLLYVQKDIFLRTAASCLVVMLLVDASAVYLNGAVATLSGVLTRGVCQMLMESAVEYLIIMIILYFACSRMYEMIAFGYHSEKLEDISRETRRADMVVLEDVEKSYDMKGIFLEVDQTIDRLIRGKGKKHILMVDYDLPARLMGDSEKVKSVMIQLLSDMVQFTRKGDIEVEVTYEKGIVPKKGQKITVVCTIACAENLSEHLVHGKALGFTQAEKLIQELGGVIWDESGGEPYHTCYVVSFQQTVDSEETIRQIKQRHREEQKKLISDSRKKEQDILYAGQVRALVVDDSYVNQKLIRAILKACGIQAVCVSSGDEAIEKVKTKAFDFIILDHMMPVKGGIQIAKEIRMLGEPYFEMLPMMAMTSSVTEEAREMFRNNGFTEVISKPIKEDEMRQATANCMFLQGGTDERNFDFI